MNAARVRRAGAMLLVAAITGVAACRRDRAADGVAHGATAASENDASAARSAVQPRDTTREPGQLHLAVAAPVRLWEGADARSFEVLLRTGDPASATARRFGTITMQTALRSRSGELVQYPCTSCHLGRRIVLRDERRRDAHRNITAAHPVQTGGTCSTCHSSDDVQQLALKSGERGTLDHAYRLCAQCHFAQADAWAGGAHGKRLDGWQGRRVVMGCADCHDPHQPALVPRIPFRAPRIERIREPTP